MVVVILLPGSRGATPPGLSRKSPTVDAGVQVNSRPAPGKLGNLPVYTLALDSVTNPAHRTRVL